MFKITEMNQIEEFFNNELETAIRGYTTDDGTVYVNLEDVCIGLGFTDTKKNVFVATSGDKKEYSRKSSTVFIRWNRVFKYLNEFDYEFEDSDIKKEQLYIPEGIFYMLAMKAKNEAAKNFQKWLAFEVIPEIRMTGVFASKKYEPIRALSVFARKLETSSISRLISYYKAKNYPIKRKALYVELSTIVNSIAKVENGERDKADLYQLSSIVYSELNIRNLIEQGIGINLEPDEIKAAIWNWLLGFSEYTTKNSPENIIHDAKKKKFTVIK